jgi:hypothetical protein
MLEDFIEHNKQIFRTGDFVTCEIYGSTILDARIYVCSQEEAEKVMGSWYHDEGKVKGIIFIFNNVTHGAQGFWQPDCPFGYPYKAGSLIRKTDDSLSDGVFNLKKVFKNELSSVIDLMILMNKQAIDKAVLKHEE